MLNKDLFIIKQNFKLFKEKIIKKFTKKKKIVAVIQVRMESTRLPGKAMMRLGGKPCLQHVIERVAASKKIDEIIIATTKRKADDYIIKFVEFMQYFMPFNADKIKWYRGDVNDVYGRVLEAARQCNADIIVDITADCPLVDPVLIDTFIDAFIKNKNDYASNVIHRAYPDGFDIQICTREFMEYGNNIIINEKDRENATYNFVRHANSMAQDRKLNYGSYGANLKYTWPKLRLTLDTKDDYKLLKKIFKEFEGKGYFSFVEVIDFLLKNPELITKKNLNN